MGPVTTMELNPLAELTVVIQQWQRSLGERTGAQ